MILNLLRVEALKVEEMIKRSFSENAAQKVAPEQQKQIVQVSLAGVRPQDSAHSQTEKQLAKLPKIECSVCEADISPFYDLTAEIVRINTQFIVKASWENNIGKTLGTGRIVVLNNGVSSH